MDKNIKTRIIHVLKHNTTIQNMYRYIVGAVVRFVGVFVKTDDKLVLMNGHGYKYNDSPRAIHEKMCEAGIAKDFKIVWALNDPELYSIPECQIIKMDTLRYFITALKAKYWVSCVNIERALKFKKKNTIYLNTWHGALINLCGNAVNGRNDFHWDHINYFCVCSDYEKPYIIRDFGVKENALITTGYPRNDKLYKIENQEVEMLKRKLEIPFDKKIILYAPTWRETKDGGSTYELLPPIDWNLWKEKLGDEYIVLLRTHPYTTKLMNVNFDNFVRNCTEYPEVNHLLMVADILISDYSSISLDYCILEKPMICFGYDYETYSAERGFYYDLDENMPGGVVRTQDGIINRILNMNYEKECDMTRIFKNQHMQYGGNATVECINRLFDVELK